jgi:hypothetical protein
MAHCNVPRHPCSGVHDIKIPHDGHEQQLSLKLVPDRTIFSKLWITCIAMACFGVVRGIATGGQKNSPDAKIRIVMNQTYRILRYLSGIHYYTASPSFHHRDIGIIGRVCIVSAQSNA